MGAADLTGRTVAFRHQPLGPNIDPRGIAGYYCDFSHKGEDALRFPDRMPRGPFGDPLPWTIPVAQAALGLWELRLRANTQEVTDAFESLASWLLEHAEPVAGGLGWPCAIYMTKYGLKPGWISALGQSESISVLLRAHLLTGDERYLEAARAGFEPLNTPVERGGSLRRLHGQTVLEEYPTRQPAAVLNGWIFGLFGIHELANATGDASVRGLFDESYQGVLALLERYDAGWWSLYSLYDHGSPDFAKAFYQRLHPVLLRALAVITPNPTLVSTAERWEAQYTTPGLIRLSANKVRFRTQRVLKQRRERD